VDYFSPEGHLVNTYGTVSMQPSRASIQRAEVNNGQVAFAILGGTLGALMGLAGGLARRRVPRALMATAVGLAAGVGTSLAIAWATGQAYQRWFDAVAENILCTLLFHGANWAAIGAAGGLAFGLGFGGRRAVARGIVGGLVGGLLGTLLFELLGTAVFPMDRTFQPVSLSKGSRFLARMSVAVCVTAGTAIALLSSGSPPISRHGAPSGERRGPVVS
jgi:hypothetical protein